MKRDPEILEYIFSHEEKIKLRTDYFERDFMAYCWYYFPHEFVHPVAQVQEEYCYDLQNLCDVFAVTFREFAKTMFLIMYYSWIIAYRKKRYIMHYNSDHTQAKSILLAVIIILQTNKRYIHDYGSLYIPEGGRKQGDPTKKTVGEFITNNQVKMQAMSMGMSPRGMTFYSNTGVTYRPDCISFDDIDTISNVDNPKIIDSDIRFILGEVFGGTAASCQKIFLGNVIKEQGRIPSLKKHFEENNEKMKIHWISIRKKGKIQWDRFVATNEEADRLNKGITDERAMYVSLQQKRKDQGTVGYNQNFNLIPYTEGQGIIKRTFFRYWHNRPKQVRTIMGIDPASSESRLSDPIGIVITHHYKTEDGRTFKYIQDAYALRGEEKNEERFVKFTKELYEKNSVNLIRIEPKGGGDILARMLKKHSMAVHTPNKGKKDKVQHMLEHQGEFERGEVLFRAGMSSELEEQLLGFPNLKEDDLVDGMNYSLEDDKIGGFSQSVVTK